jgi:hypothetical protein
MLRSIVVWFTWIFAVIFVPIETYLSFVPIERYLTLSSVLIPLSGYAVNVFGVGIMLWGAVSLRRGRPYAEGVLATGWGWTTAAFWRATNSRYWLAEQGAQLYFGPAELWLAPVFTIMVGAALAGSVVLLLNRHRRPDGCRAAGPG